MFTLPLKPAEVLNAATAFQQRRDGVHDAQGLPLAPHKVAAGSDARAPLMQDCTKPTIQSEVMLQAR